MLGGPGFGGREQRRVVDREIAVVVLDDGQSCLLNTGEEEKLYSKGKSRRL